MILRSMPSKFHTRYLDMKQKLRRVYQNKDDLVSAMETRDCDDFTLIMNIHSSTSMPDLSYGQSLSVVWQVIPTFTTAARTYGQCYPTFFMDSPSAAKLTGCFTVFSALHIYSNWR